MIALLISVFLFVQSRGLEPGAGIVTGSIKILDGGPAAGVRVAAIAVDDPDGKNLLSITETDSAGRYRLNNIPNGNYFIVAGRVASLTYYPGGSDPAKAKEIAVEAARIISSIDFSVPADSKINKGVSPTKAATGRKEELIAWLQLDAETNIDRKLNLAVKFQKDYPKSEVLPEVFQTIMDVYVAREKTGIAAAYVEKVLKTGTARVASLIKLSQTHYKESDLNHAIQDGEEAVALAEELAKRPPPAPYAGPAWESWIALLQKKSASNLVQLRQFSAAQNPVPQN
jgi:hypothetical protein